MPQDRWACAWCGAEVAADRRRCDYCGGFRPRAILLGVAIVLVTAAVVYWLVT